MTLWSYEMCDKYKRRSFRNYCICILLFNILETYMLCGELWSIRTDCLMNSTLCHYDTNVIARSDGTL